MQGTDREQYDSLGVVKCLSLIHPFSSPSRPSSAVFRRWSGLCEESPEVGGHGSKSRDVGPVALGAGRPAFAINRSDMLGHVGHAVDLRPGSGLPCNRSPALGGLSTKKGARGLHTGALRRTAYVRAARASLV